MKGAWSGGLAIGLGLLMLLPHVAAQGESPVTVTMEQAHVLDLATVQEDNTHPDGSTEAGLLSPCGAGHLDVTGDGHGLRFQEGQDERGCAEARFDVPIPIGARGVDVRFGASKSVLQPTTAGIVDLTISVNTELRLASADQSSVFPFMRKDVRAEEDPDLGFQFPLAGEGTLAVAWFFHDEGPNVRSDIPGPAFGQRVEVDIIDPVLWFTGIQVAPEAVQSTGEVGRDTARQDLEIRFEVDALGRYILEAPPGMVFDHVLGPAGLAIPDQDLDLRQQGDGSTLVLEPELVAAHGLGTYAATYHSLTPLEANAFLVPLIGAILILPAPLGLYASRAARGLSHEAVGSFMGTARALRAALAFWWVVYVAGLAFILAFRLWPLIVSWPIQPQAALLHGMFVLVAMAFISLGVYWRRRLARTMEQELEAQEAANRALARSNEELQQFAYVASHDLQEPLRTVGRFAELVNQRYGDRLDEDGREFLGYTVEGAQRMQALIDGLLEFSRIDTKGRDFETTDLNDAAARAAAALTAAIEESGAELDLQDLPTVQADPLQMTQLFQNLLGNAVKFRAPDRPPKIRVRAEPIGDTWRIEVRDNGIGIDEKYHERIFTVFQRLHRRETYEGTGIGLAICRKIVQRHGGHITLRSKPDVGTTFFFTLPRMEAT